MYDILAKFEKGTKEYEEMLYRITCMQGYQQEIIDSCKGIIPKKVPKEWYDYGTVKKMEDNDYELSLLANKKPYFFIYNYKTLRNDLKKYEEDLKSNCIMRFGVTLEELRNKKDKTEEQERFLQYYNDKLPVSLSNSTMNRICWKLEEELDGLQKILKDTPFDTSIFTTDKKVTNRQYKQVEELYNDYKKVLNKKTKGINVKSEEEITNTKLTLLLFYKEKLEEAFIGDYELITNCLVDMLYNKPVSKQFVWGVCKKHIIDKLLKDNDNKINVPIESETGVEWQGNKYNLTKLDIGEQWEVEDEFNI